MQKLVILGIGYGGSKILHTLVSKGIPSGVEITIIDRSPYHALKTEFYALAAGTIADTHIKMNIPSHPHVKLLIAEIKSIDLYNREILTNDVNPVPYDSLIIGLGCEDNYYGIEGAKEYTESLQTVYKARKTHEKIRDLNVNSQVTIIGGGLSGVELASELRESRPDIKIQILERGSSVLSPFDDKLKQYATKWFNKHNVKIVNNIALEKIEHGKIHCTDQTLESDVIVWTAGIKPNSLLDSLDIEKDKHHKIVLNEYHQIPNHPDVYVVGDCAGLQLPPSAQLAETQGEQIAKVICSVWHGQPLPVLPALKLNGTLGSLGKKDGFGIVYNKNVTGFLPRTLKSSLLWAHKHHLH